MQLKTFGKYFLHGILFAILYILIYFIWTPIQVLLVGLGSIIGLIIGIGVLLFMLGYVNEGLGYYLWDIESETGFWGTLFHGVVLSIILLIVNLIGSALPNFVFPGTATLLITFFISTFLNGFVGRKVASWFGFGD
jgi:hypothetical protein